MPKAACAIRDDIALGVQLMGGIFLHQGAWWRKIPPISCTSKASSLHRTFGEGCWTATTQKLAEAIRYAVTRREIFDENLASGDGIANGLGQLRLPQAHPRMAQAAPPASAAGR